MHDESPPESSRFVRTTQRRGGVIVQYPGSPRDLLQLGAQQVGKEMVIAVPVPLIIQGHQKEICPFQVLQDRCG